MTKKITIAQRVSDTAQRLTDLYHEIRALEDAIDASFKKDQWQVKLELTYPPDGGITIHIEVDHPKNRHLPYDNCSYMRYELVNSVAIPEDYCSDNAHTRLLTKQVNEWLAGYFNEAEVEAEQKNDSKRYALAHLIKAPQVYVVEVNSEHGIFLYGRTLYQVLDNTEIETAVMPSFTEVVNKGVTRYIYKITKKLFYKNGQLTPIHEINH